LGNGDYIGPAANEATQARSRKRDHAKRQVWRETLVDLMRSQTGRRFAWWVVNDVCGHFAASGAPVDANTANFLAGRRHVSAQILGAIKDLDANLHAQLLSEGFRAFDEHEPKDGTDG